VDSILTVNAGSSSLKFAVFEIAAGETRERVRGQVEGLGVRPRFTARERYGAKHEVPWPVRRPPVTAVEALKAVLEWLRRTMPEITVGAVGHRIVHGGPDYSEPVILTEQVLQALQRLAPLAPLHQPHNLSGVHAARDLFGDIPQVGCFDTAFHRQQPWVSDVFALPRGLFDEGVRRYGFHGISYEYIMLTLSCIDPLLARGKIVIAHLGNGASMCAVRDGCSMGSTMGFSVLDGLPMGTRCGQLDPGVLLYLLQEKGLSIEELSHMLYRCSGLKGLSGVSHDMRELEASPLPEAAQAIDYFVACIRRELGAMAAMLGGLDALVFTGGIGENSTHIRERVCQDFEWLGIAFDRQRNCSKGQVVSADGSRVRLFVVPTDEEATIATHTRRLVDAHESTAACRSPK